MMTRTVIVAILFLLPAVAFGQADLKNQPSSSPRRTNRQPASRTADPRKPLAQPEQMPSKPAPPARPKHEDVLKEIQDLLKNLQKTSGEIQERLGKLYREGYFFWEESVAGPPHPDDFRRPTVLLPSNRQWIVSVLEKTEKITGKLQKDLEQAIKKLSQAKPGSKINPPFVDYVNRKLEEIKKELARLNIYKRQGERYLTNEQKKKIGEIIEKINELETKLEKSKNQSVNPQK